jgi:ribulose-phosphate 3-epimerase
MIGGSGRVIVAPSLYAAPLLRMGEAVRAGTEGGADAFHLDIMDGHFVGPISFGNLVVQAVRDATPLPLDAHLMVSNPASHVAWLACAGIRAVTVHVEAFAEGAIGARATLRAIRSHGMRAGIALNPATEVASIAWLDGEVDQVLVMTVEPGSSGQLFLDAVLPKVSDVVRMFGPTVEVGVDGGINRETARASVGAGARYLVAGSSVFTPTLEGVRDAIAVVRGTL